MTKDEVLATFTLAGIAVERIWKLPNGYVGDLEPLTDLEVVRDASEGESASFARINDDKTDPSPTTNVVRSWMSDYRWRFDRPAWLIKTSYGLIQITPRKRVTDVEWSDTKVRAVVTDDNVTKDGTHVHAYSNEKMLEYLKRWKTAAEAM